MQQKAIPLVQAAQIAGKAYHAMLNSVLRGDVRGYQDDHGRWKVSKADAQRLGRERRKKAKK
ncbi:hypothetical protein LCGC14_1350160 [marine sediment metagenome]|uniref:Helix-turn-helix domain-containing protein n=1 Tax=marine sediment metagenome TaxID=412755 RepID=A0A0F9KX72_9ZZZZ